MKLNNSINKKTYIGYAFLICSRINVQCSHYPIIKKLTKILKEVLGFNEEPIFDPSKSDLNIRKLLNSERINNLGFKLEISLKQGLVKIYQDYIKT